MALIRMTEELLQEPLRADEILISLPSAGFEGPFHLLWEMIQAHHLDITRLPLVFVADTYLRYIEEMRKLDIDIASEILVIAAELLRIKSQLLLPVEERVQDETEQVDPETFIRDLASKVLRYRKYAEAAEKLGAMPLVGIDVFVRSKNIIMADIKPETAVEGGQVDAFTLVRSLAAMIERSEKKPSIEYFTERIRIADRISELASFFSKNETAKFSELLSDNCSRYDIIVTFLAILEMVKLKMLCVHQADPSGEIHLATISREELFKPFNEENGFDYR